MRFSGVAFGCAVLLGACASQPDRVILREAESPSAVVLTSEFQCRVGRIVAEQRIRKHRDSPPDNFLSIRVAGREVRDVAPIMKELVELSGDELSSIPLSILRCRTAVDGSDMSFLATYRRGDFRVLKVVDGRLRFETATASVEE
jgi:hypothetical protein